jgi:hypothetical protein
MIGQSCPGVDWLICKLIGVLQVRWLIDRSIDRLISWLIGWLAGWLVDWLVGCQVGLVGCIGWLVG